MRPVIAICVCSVLLATGIGCRASADRTTLSAGSQSPAVVRSPLDETDPASASAQANSVSAVSFDRAPDPSSIVNAALQTEFDPDEQLSLALLIAEVQTVHPSVNAMYSAWQAAAQRYPQMVSLDDPMFGATLAPASFGSRDVESAYALEASQKLPWHGKRA